MVQKVKKADGWTVRSLLLPATTDFTKGRIELYQKKKKNLIRRLLKITLLITFVFSLADSHTLDVKHTVFSKSTVPPSSPPPDCNLDKNSLKWPIIQSIPARGLRFSFF